MADKQPSRARQVIPAIFMLQKHSYELASSIVTTSVTNCDVLLAVIKQRRDGVPRIEHYYQQIVPMYSLDDFKSHFRLSRHSFQILKVEMEKAPSFNRVNGPSVNTEKELLMFLWYVVKHYRLFPKALGDILNMYKVQELHLSQTQGLWRYEDWGYPPEDSPPGVELWAWFQPNARNIDSTWAELVNALSGLFCASLNFMDSKSTVIPKWSFRPSGLASEYYSFDSRFMRYAALPREIVCTENLTPWVKLLPCESQVGLASLFNGIKLFDSNYQSLGLHVRPICQDTNCMKDGIELKQTLTVILNPAVYGRGFQNWNLKSLFDRSLHETCPMAESSKILVDVTLHQDKNYSLNLAPEADSVSTFTRGGETKTYHVYDLQKQTGGRTSLNLNGFYSAKVIHGDVYPPPLYANRYITGYGLEKGGITCMIYNNLNTNLTVLYMETIPWYLRVYFNSIKIEANKFPVKPYKTHFIPGKDRSKPYQLELVFRLPPNSVTKVSMEFDRAFLRWTEYPPDANHGFYINSAVISTMLPTGRNFTSPPQHGSTLEDSMTDDSREFFLRIHTESLLVSLPTPDFSMPYNVICLACTVVAIAFGSLHNLTTRSFTVVDPNKKKLNPLSKLKQFLRGVKKDSGGQTVVDENRSSEPENNKSDLKTEKT